MSLVAKLLSGQAQSISQLTQGTTLTRQAVTKHLKVLQRVGIVRSTYAGRETLFELDARPFKDMQDYLAFISDEWDRTIGQLKSYVED